MNKDKSILEIVLMPLVIVIVGISSSFIISFYEIESSEKFRAAELEVVREQAKTDREIKIIEIFSEKIVSKDEKERILALKILDLIDSKIAKDLARIVAENEPINSIVRKTAEREISKASQKIHNKKFISQSLSLCEKYTQYSKTEWETNFLKKTHLGTWHVFIASLPQGTTKKDAKYQILRFEKKHSNLAFSLMETISSSGRNTRYAIVLAEGLDSDKAKEIALFSNKCNIVKGAYAMQQSL